MQQLIEQLQEVDKLAPPVTADSRTHARYYEARLAALDANLLVLEEPTSDNDALLHFTIGTPCFAEYADCDRAEEWYAVYGRMVAPLEQMG